MRRPLGLLALALTLLVLGAAGFLTRDRWLPLVRPNDHAEAAPDHHDHHPQADRIKLTPQARDNLKLVVRPLNVQTYRRTLQVPGTVIDRPGHSDRGVTAPVVGVVTRVHAFPGDTVRPGVALFDLRLVSEYVQNSQTELFKAVQEIKLTQEQVARLKEATQAGAVSGARMLELGQQERRLSALVTAYRQDLLVRGLRPEQVDAAAEGRFVKELTVAAPRRPGEESPPAGPVAPAPSSGADELFEVQELKVQLGEQVQAGQLLAVLSNHRSLYLEGRAFKKEALLLERAAQQGWALEAEFTEDEPRVWPALDQPLTIRHLANAVDPASRTFGFYVPLRNQSRSYERDGQTFLVWRFRPGQRVRLHVPVEEFKDVFVLPAGAVAREGPDAYVFRQSGDSFDRKPVRVLFEDRRHVVLANDGSVAPGNYVAQNGAAALHRVLKARQAGGEGGHGHDHHGHSH